MAPTAYVAPVVSSESIFRADLFKGKVLFCTGGGSGICKAMTETMMRHGANAVIVGRKIDRLTQSAADLQKSTGKKCLPAQADVRRPQELKDAVAKTIEAFGRIDYVICGAAGNFLATIDGMSENAFKTVIEIDTLGTFHTVKATLPYIRESKGSYIHVSAMLHYRGTPFQVHVSAAKAAVDALSAVLAVEEGPKGVRSNVIAPGPIGETEGWDRLSNKANGSAHGNFPLGRVGHLKDIENATVFLFSDAAANITGQILPVDGAFTHVVGLSFPYPQAVLDTESVKHMIKPRL